ncbi:hypothetical protein [Actinokineospora enzanensis]|uniref:hypothetical protein n=1 Tax=Actinokineospora enzanensis TaxID=155975 RepID=UPI00037BE0F6|nr:hypothetical protein [Actinokineospora enzanensis]
MRDRETELPRLEELGVLQTIGPWQVSLRWPKGTDQGGPWYMEVRVDPTAAPEDAVGGISSTVLRQVDFRQAADAWRRLRGAPSSEVDRLRTIASAADDLSKIIRPLVNDGLTDEYLAWLATAYVTFVEAGVDSVTGHLSDVVRRQPDTIRSHLKEARNRGLLTAVKGRAGGQLTDEAKRIISVGLQGDGIGESISAVQRRMGPPV